MSPEQIAELVSRAQARYAELSARWHELGLPGLPFMPGEFTAMFLLGLFPGTPEEIAARVREGETRFRALRDQRVFSRSASEAETDGVFALALMDALSLGGTLAAVIPAEPAQPMPPPPAQVTVREVVRETKVHEVIKPCPYYAHDPKQCAIGVYAVLPLVVPSVPVPDVAPAVADSPAVQGCEHVGTDGKCAACTADETEECYGDDCERQVIVAKTAKCKAYGEGKDDCNRIFCTDCADECLNKHGYCDDCENIECDGCQSDLDHGTEKVCANPDCKGQEDFCEDCAPRLLTSAGLCASCANEEVWDCDDCGTGYLESRITKCAGDKCEHSYCDDCKANNLDKGRLCADCVS